MAVLLVMEIVAFGWLVGSTEAEAKTLKAKAKPKSTTNRNIQF